MIITWVETEYGRLLITSVLSIVENWKVSLEKNRIGQKDVEITVHLNINMFPRLQFDLFIVGMSFSSILLCN